MRSVLADFCGTEPTAGGARPRQLHDSWYLGKMQEGSTKGPLGAAAGSRERAGAALGFLKYTTDHSDLVAMENTLPVRGHGGSGRATRQVGTPSGMLERWTWLGPRLVRRSRSSNLVDPASSHTLVSKIKPCTSK